MLPLGPCTDRIGSDIEFSELVSESTLAMIDSPSRSVTIIFCVGWVEVNSPRVEEIELEAKE